MPSAQTIRTDSACLTYAAVIDNFRRAYNALYNNRAEDLTDQEVLFCWEEGWTAATGEEEDVLTVEVMREKVLAKLSEE